MPALANVAGICRIAVQYASASQSLLNIFHVGSPSNASSWISGDIDEACHMIYNAYAAFITSNMSSNITGFVCSGQDLTSVTGVQGTFSGVVSGSAGGSNIPLSACGVISWKASRHYRGGHPRTYVGGLTVDALANNREITSTYGTNLQALGNAILSNLAGGTYSRSPAPGLVAVHRTLDKLTLATPLVDTITACTVGPRVDSQRRRLGKE